MPPLEMLIECLVATAVFAYMPGPSMLYAAAQTVARGRRAGWWAAAGIHLGGYVHVAGASLGLAALFAAIPVVYAVLKLAGAGYLIWLGIRMFRARPSADDVNIQTAARTPRQAFRESVMVEVLNPKTAIFYVAFLPQFTDDAAALPIWGQLFILGTVVNVMFSSADVLSILLADRMVAVLRASGSANRVAQRLGGGVLVALGVNLALNRH